MRRENLYPVVYHGGLNKSPRWALRLGIICWASLVLIAWLTASGHIAGFDEQGLLYWRNANGNVAPAMLEWVRDLTSLGGVFLRNLFTLFAVAALLVLSRGREAIWLAVTVIGGWLTNSAIKYLVERPRPSFVSHLTEAAGPSFPSGHSFNAAVVALAIAFAFNASITSRPIRITLLSLAIVLSMAIAWSRVWLGVHYPSDVIAGWLGGAGWVFIASILLQPNRLNARRRLP